METQRMQELFGLFTEGRLQRIGRLACRAHALRQAHADTQVAERQNKVGPGATGDAWQVAMQAVAAVEAEIVDGLGAAQAERDDHLLARAVHEGVDDEHTIRERLGHELSDRDRYKLRDLRAAAAERTTFSLEQTSAPSEDAADRPGVSGATGKTEPPA
jgi:hypothetical protein